MIQPRVFFLAVSPVGFPLLLQACWPPAFLTAITMTMIARLADKKSRIAPSAISTSKDDLALFFHSRNKREWTENFKGGKIKPVTLGLFLLKSLSASGCSCIRGPFPVAVTHPNRDLNYETADDY